MMSVQNIFFQDISGSFSVLTYWFSTRKSRKTVHVSSGPLTLRTSRINCIFKNMRQNIDDIIKSILVNKEKYGITLNKFEEVMKLKLPIRNVLIIILRVLSNCKPMRQARTSCFIAQAISHNLIC